jgi:tRNA pseudouridine38-40 synthase
LRLVMAYDGGPFSGFARQRDRRTVQGELEAALERLAKRPVVTVGAGRTDAGVHARGQVVHADVPARLDPERVRRALNGGLGPAIVVREAAWAPPGFDARLSARRRTYVYRVDDSGWWGTGAATRRARSRSWPPPTAPGPATSPPPTAWSWRR